MKLILVTGDAGLSTSKDVLKSALDKGFWRIHLRVYDAQRNELRNFLTEFDEDHLRRIVIHDHYDLCNEFPLAGIHLQSTSKDQPLTEKFNSVSTSAHSIDEICDNRFNYLFLGPVYDSISKQGYLRNDALMKFPLGPSTPVFAIGGVKPQHLQELSEKGFQGAAILGGIWNSGEPFKMIENYISYSSTKPESHG
jgi:thiamine-phosphate pyrophosphorylase